MNRRLWLLNVILLAGCGYLGWHMREQWQQARLRERRLLAQRPKLPDVVTPSALSPVVPVTPVNYLDIAQRVLFSRDRNPTVIVEVPPPPPPKPKPPTPPMPLAYGYMEFGGEPTILMAEKAGAVQHKYHTGDKVGPFTILAVNRKEIQLEWPETGDKITKKLEDLVDKNPVSTAAAPAPNQVEQIAPAGAAASNAAPQNLSASSPQSQEPVKAGPGAEIDENRRAAVPNDPAPVGTVQDGYKKNCYRTPFGNNCVWEKVK